MHRRQFLSSSLAASALTLAHPGEALTHPGEALASGSGLPGKSAPEFYQMRRYQLASGPHPKMTEAFFAEALIPALNRMGITPVGAFSLDIGPQTPVYYLLMPGSTVETLVTVDLELAKDDAFMKAAAPFWGAPAGAPAFERVESTLMRAFEGWPKLTPPASAATHGKRIFQLRTYESPSYAAHVRKVEMFHSGEFDIFAKAGCGQVFYSDVLVGPRTPKLTYMLTFKDMAELEAKWDNFRNDPDWKKLSSSPRFAYEAIVSNIDNLILKPLACSQI